jgi:hypothetical protein
MDSPLAIGRIYLFTERTDGLVSATCAARKKLFANAADYQFSQHYDVYVEDKRILGNLPELKEELEDYQANIVVPLFTPSEPYSKFIIAQVSIEQIEGLLPLFVQQAEQISADSTLDAFINLTMQEPDTSRKIFKNIFAKREPESGSPQSQNSISDMLCGFGGAFAVGMASAMYAINLDTSLLDDGMPAFASAMDNGASPSSINIPLGSVKTATKSRPINIEKQMYENFINNCIEFGKLEQESHNSEAIKLKRTILLKNLKVVMRDAYGVVGPPDRIALSICKYPYLRDSYEDLYNRYSIGNHSKVHIGVEESNSIKAINSNDGKIRLFLETETKNQKIYLHFSRKPSFIVYLIYLLDKFHLDTNAFELSISDCKSLFCELFYKTYHEYGSNVFDNLVKKKLHGDSHGVEIADCLTDIKNVMRKVFDELRMPAEHLAFIIPNKKSHLTIRSKNIILSDDFKSLVVRD